MSRYFVGVTILAALLIAGCGALGGGGGQPVATIQSPVSGTTVAVNTAVTVTAMGEDPNGPGVFRLDLIIDGVTVDTFESPSAQPTISAALSFTPTTEGAKSVVVIAYREDGTASIPATVAISVVGMTTESGTDGGSDGDTQSETVTPDTSGSGSSETPESDTAVSGRANTQVAIRERPGPGCPIIGYVEEDDIADFLEVTTSPDLYWYQTDYLGEDNLGWVYHDPFTLLDDDSELPRVPEQGCLYCGDGICSEEIGEVCDECVQDCGVCPYCGDGAVNQASEECDISGCGQGYSCNNSCQCIADPYCGDGAVNQPSEECDGGGCATGFSCTASCTCTYVIK